MSEKLTKELLKIIEAGESVQQNSKQRKISYPKTYLKQFVLS